MNNALSKVKDWFLMNKLNLNPSKTRYMIFNHKTDKTNQRHTNYEGVGQRHRKIIQTGGNTH